MTRLVVLIAVPALMLASPAKAHGQGVSPPDTVGITSGALRLRGLVWRPERPGPLPAVLFNDGSYETRDSSIMLEAATIGPVLARRGCVVFVLFRQGVGLSVGQDSSGGDLKGRRDVDQSRIALIGFSFGGSLSLLQAARDATVRAIVGFAGAAGSWEQSPQLRERLVAAVGRTSAPIFFIHAANDYSTTSGTALAAEMKHLGRRHLLRIYPPFGRSTRDGHNVIYRVVGHTSDPGEPNVYSW